MENEALVNEQDLYQIFWFPRVQPRKDGELFGDGFMTTLTDLGFSKGIIVETVLSTYNKDGLANAAPMGVAMNDHQSIIIKIYTSSKTYKNLQSKRCAVANVTFDPEVFYRTAFKEVTPKGRLPQEWFEKAETVDAPRLRMAEAHIEVAVEDIATPDTERAKISCNVKLVSAPKILPKVYCRALFASIEAILHATRVKAFMTDADRQKREQAFKLLEKINECSDIVNRVAPNSRYSGIMADLEKRVDLWRLKSESLR